jgi:hypothetical protein
MCETRRVGAAAWETLGLPLKRLERLMESA